MTLTVTQAAAKAGVSPSTIRHWCRMGAVAATKIGRRWHIDPASLDYRISLTRPQEKKELAANGPGRLPGPEPALVPVPGGDGQPAPPEVYDLPADQLDRAIAKLEAANRRAARHGIPDRFTWEVEHYEQTIEETDEDGIARRWVIPRVRLTLNRPEIKHKGWRFVGVLTWDNEAGMVSRTVPGETLRHRPDRRWCDHCQTERDRRDTYIVRHDDGTELQVGKTCLSAFLGITPGNLWMLTYSPDLAPDEDDDFGDPDMRRSVRMGRRAKVSAKNVIAVALAVVNRHGWVSRAAAGEGRGPSTSARVQTVLFPAPGEPEEIKRWRREIMDHVRRIQDDIEEVRRFAATYPGDDEFAVNLRTLASSEWIDARNIGLLAYAVAAKMRADEEAARKVRSPEAGGHVGTVGERVTVEARLVAKHNLGDGQWGPRTLLTFVTPQGQTLKWFKSGLLGTEYRIGDTVRLTGVVASHDEWHGKPATKIKNVRLERISRVGRPGDLEEPESVPVGWLTVGDRLEHRTGRFGTVERISRRHSMGRIVFDIDIRDDETGEIVEQAIRSDDTVWRVAQAPHTPLEDAEEIRGIDVRRGDLLWVNTGSGRHLVTVNREVTDRELAERGEVYDDAGDLIPDYLVGRGVYRVVEVTDRDGTTHWVGLSRSGLVARVNPTVTPAGLEQAERAALERAARRAAQEGTGAEKEYVSNTDLSVGDRIEAGAQDPGTPKVLNGEIVSITRDGDRFRVSVRDQNGKIHTESTTIYRERTGTVHVRHEVEIGPEYAQRGDRVRVPVPDGNGGEREVTGEVVDVDTRQWHAIKLTVRDDQGAEHEVTLAYYRRITLLEGRRDLDGSRYRWSLTDLGPGDVIDFEWVEPGEIREINGVIERITRDGGVLLFDVRDDNGTLYERQEIWAAHRVSPSRKPPTEDVVPSRLRKGDRLWVNIGTGRTTATVIGRRPAKDGEQGFNANLTPVYVRGKATVLTVRTEDGETGEIIVGRGATVERVVDLDRVATGWAVEELDLAALDERAKAREAFRARYGLTEEEMEAVERAALTEARRRVRAHGDVGRVKLAREPLGYQIVPKEPVTRVPAGLEVKVPLLREDGMRWDGKPVREGGGPVDVDAPEVRRAGGPAPAAPETPEAPEARVPEAPTPAAPAAPETPEAPEARAPEAPTPGGPGPGTRRSTARRRDHAPCTASIDFSPSQPPGR